MYQRQRDRCQEVGKNYGSIKKNEGEKYVFLYKHRQME